MKCKFGYINPFALELEVRVGEVLTGATGLLKMTDILSKMGLENNRSNQVLVGGALKKNGFRKVRTYPDKKYLYTRDSGEELLESARERVHGWDSISAGSEGAVL